MPDLRTWLDKVDKLGQLMRVDNVHWDLELSTLTEIINERTKSRPGLRRGNQVWRDAKSAR